MRQATPILFLLLALLPACAHQPRSLPAALAPTMPATSPAALLAQTPWRLTHINNTPISLPTSPTPLPDSRWPSLTLTPATTTDPARISGFSAVNRWSASINNAVLPQGLFQPGMPLATKMAGPPELMQIEQNFFTALSSITRYNLSDLNNTLTLLDDSNTPRLQFTRSTPNP